MQLTERELDIIACTSFDANFSASQIGDATGYKEHSIRQSLKKLLDNGTICLRPYVNPFALGLLEFHALITVLTPGEAALKKLIRACVASTVTTYVSEISGEHHITVMFLATSFDGAVRFFDELCEKAPGIEFRKTVAPVVELAIAAPKLHSREGGNNVLRYGAVRDIAQIDELDGKILTLLGATNVSSMRDLAQRCGAPRTTIDYRLQSLMSRGLLLAIGYSVPSYKDGLFPNLFRVSASRPCAELHKLMNTLAETHKAIRCIVRTCGEWDYEISARLTDPRLSSSLAQELHKYLEKFVSKVVAVPELYCHKIYVNPEELGVLRELLAKSK
jgi:DNA-binding Lrp family transcriptional regulator